MGRSKVTKWGECCLVKHFIEQHPLFLLGAAGFVGFLNILGQAVSGSNVNGLPFDTIAGGTVIGLLSTVFILFIRRTRDQDKRSDASADRAILDRDTRVGEVTEFFQAVLDHERKQHEEEILRFQTRVDVLERYLFRDLGLKEHPPPAPLPEGP